MMFQSARVLLFALSVMWSAAALSGQVATTDNAHAVDPAESSLNPGHISLDVVVTDQAGHPVLSLKPEDLQLLDNGIPQRLVSFQTSDENSIRSDQKTEIIFLIDRLNLSAQQESVAEKEVAKFLTEHNGRLARPVMLYQLSSYGLSSLFEPSTNGNELADTLMRGRESKTIWTVPAHHEGAPRDDAEQARNEASLKALGAIAIQERKRPNRKLLFWVGPGWPTESGGHYSFEEIVELSTRLREARLSLFSVTAWAYQKREFTFEEYLKGVMSKKDARTGDVSLEVLATKSGGVVTAPAFGLQATIDRCIEDANDFYTVSFVPLKPDHPDEYHELKIIVKGRDASARTNFEYYNQPSYVDQPAALQRVTVEQFENDLQARRGQSDAELAGYISTIQLTERLDHEAFARLSSLMHGQRSRDALVPIADLSAFLPPPALDIPQYTVPDSNEQDGILLRLKQYLTETISDSQNFFATRNTVLYSEPKQNDEQMQAWKTMPVDQSLHPFSSERLTVLVRNSKEVTDSVSASKKSNSRERSLFADGTFGPILSMVFKDSTSPGGEVDWSRWEMANGRRLAVFRFAMRDIAADLEVGFCCLAESDGTLPYKRKTAYHGEMVVDPLTGVLLRIWIQADLPLRLPINRSAIAVDYGPIVIGGKTYFRPIKSVAISRSRTLKMLHEWDQNFGVYGPFQTLLNDVTFTGYHIFRSEHRILTDYAAEP
jgi:VWFA-related protein